MRVDDRPILILGGTGRLGRLLARAGMAPALWQGRRAAAGVDRVLDPLAEPLALARAAAGASAILCLAGPVRGTAADLAVHVPLALAAVAAGRGAGVPVLLASSAAVYGRPDGPCREDGPAHPLSDYGRAKQAMERAAMDAAKGHPVAVLRIGNVSGADALLGGGSAAREVALDILPDGRAPRRSWIGPRALARILADLSRAPGLPGVLNLCLPGVIGMDALLDAAGIRWRGVPAPASVIPEVCLDVTRLGRLIDLAPFGSGAAALVRDWRSVPI